MFKKLFGTKKPVENTVESVEEVVTASPKCDDEEAVTVEACVTTEGGEEDFSDIEDMFSDIDSLMDEVAEDIKSEEEKKEKMKITNLLKAYISKLRSVPFHFECQKLARKHQVDVSRIKNASAQRTVSNLAEVLDLVFDALYVTIETLVKLVSYIIMNVANFALNVLRKVSETLFAPTPKLA